MSEDEGKSEWLKFRVEPARKIAYYAAAEAQELDFSEWARDALDERLQRDLGMTVGAPTTKVPPFQPAHEEG